jgi:hypothetical protein
MQTITRPIERLRDAVHAAASEASENFTNAILNGDSQGIDLAAAIAKDIAVITNHSNEVFRKYLNSTFASNASAGILSPKTDEGTPPMARNRSVAREPSPEPAGEPMKTSHYRRPILAALTVLGGASNFRVIQDVMVLMMAWSKQLREIDTHPTKGTTSPRVVANSRSHRATMIRQGFIVGSNDQIDRLSASGAEEGMAWFAEHGTTVEQMRQMLRELESKGLNRSDGYVLVAPKDVRKALRIVDALQTQEPTNAPIQAITREKKKPGRKPKAAVEAVEPVATEEPQTVEFDASTNEKLFADCVRILNKFDEGKKPTERQMKTLVKARELSIVPPYHEVFAGLDHEDEANETGALAMRRGR